MFQICSSEKPIEETDAPWIPTHDWERGSIIACPDFYVLALGVRVERAVLFPVYDACDCQASLGCGRSSPAKDVWKAKPQEE